MLSQLTCENFLVNEVIESYDVLLELTEDEEKCPRSSTWVAPWDLVMAGQASFPAE